MNATKMKLAVAFAAILMAGVAPVFGQGQAPNVTVSWLPLGKIAAGVSVTNSSSRTALPAGGDTAYVFNSGANDAFVAVGGSTVAASTTLGGSTVVKAGTCQNINLRNVTGGIQGFIAAITASSTTTLAVETGIGSASCSGGGGGGGGGSVTQGTSPWVDNITQWASVSLGAATGWGVAPSGNVPGVNANILASVPLPVTGTFWPYTIGQQPTAASVPVTGPSDPDSRPVTGNITVQDTGSSTASGQSLVPIITGTPTAGSFQSQAINGQAIARVQVSGTWTGTVEFDGSIDGGTTWQPVTARVVGAGVSLNSITANGMFEVSTASLTNMRLRATAAVTGTATIRFVFTAGSSPSQLVVADPCQYLAKTFTPISIQTNTTTRIVSPAVGKRTYACSFIITTAAINNVGVVEGTGGTCGSGTAGVIGGTTSTNGLNLLASGGLATGGGGFSTFATAGTNVDLCLITSVATPLAGVIGWVQAP